MNKLLPILAVVLLLSSCAKQELSNNESAAEAAAKQKAGSNIAAKQESITFSQISSTTVPGGGGAAEISAYDPSTKKLFVVNNSAGNNRIDVYNLSNPAAPVALTFINTVMYGGFVNSVYVSNGKLAAAIEATTKTNSGKVLVFNTSDYSVLANITVGALPDMVTFSPDGKYILTANEGEPNDAYTIDPIGSVSIISVEENYAVTTLDFSGFESQAAQLKAKGFRIFGKNASFAQDIEPEYVAVSENSKKAWVTLQENNGIALIDLNSKTIENIFPLGYKDYNAEGNTIDASDQPSATPPIVDFKNWPVKGIYLPDGIAVLPNNNVPFVFTANEGDARAYSGFNEERRLGSAAHVFDPFVFPNAATLKLPANLGRLLSTTTLGDIDGDGDYDELYSYGARSFSIWHGLTGELIFDSKDFIDREAFRRGKYPDSRSDDKGCEPEGIAIGRVGNNNLLFVGLERANAVMVFDVTNPRNPEYLQWLNAGVGPEGVLFVPASESPNGKSLLIVSSEVDGTVKIYTTN
jgi:DNA-binding beta-propeller fold protein YncE